jgi:transposase-like protein
VLVELTMTEQRYRAVLEVQAGVPVAEVAERFGVSRQAVHRWVGRYRRTDWTGWPTGSHRPRAHPAQTPPEVEAAICELRRTHPRWGQRRIAFELGRNGCPGPIPSVSTIHRVLVRHGMVDAVPRRRRRVSCRGALVVAGQRNYVGMVHAGRTTVEGTDHTFRIHDGDELLTEVPRTTTKTIARFKVRKPEPPRRPERTL